ncbi:restriction endonuclease FokI C-terminal domain-containing protein [Rosistilla oblonga]|uniref:restriction endonuclease FokI C-terminal domain-containing protein n=1 Tax=Rosistilla oblonga TaxID=2527990 RepID=UPI003A970C30
MILTPEQQSRAVEVMQEYLAAPKGPEGVTPAEASAERDRQRIELIESELLPLVQAYLAGRTPLDEFKSKVDGINKRNEHWGFKGIKGQMFFNMIVNVSSDPGGCDQELKSAIAVPTSEDMARSRIRTFASYVRRLGEEHVEAGGSKQGRPKEGSIPFFLSYFWQLQSRDVWPVYYTNGVKTMSDLNLWLPTDDLAADYISFKHLHEELAALFTEKSGKQFGLYDVEHVFWFKGGNPYGGSKPLPKDQLEPAVEVPEEVIVAPKLDRLPDSYVPPVIAVLPRIAANESGFDDLAKASGISLSRAFEKNIHAAFTILGFDAKLLGQGGGRVPDGIAVEHDSSYALIWDAKVRGDGYSMGTDDRTIREYITTQSRELKRRRSIRNVYYVVVSSEFSDDFDESIRSMKMETEISEVCLLEASALVSIVDAKLRDPLQVSLGPDGVQRLFSTSGIVNVETVRQNLIG